MSHCPAIVLALREYGFLGAADLLSEAKAVDDELQGLAIALATLDGAQHVLRRHAKALAHTSAALERGRLRGLEEQITDRLGDLLRRRARARGL